MIDRKISKKYFIGKTVEKGKWASVYSYAPKSTELMQKRGEIFAVIALKSHPKFAIATAGNLLLDFFHEHYFESKQESTLSALENSMLATSKHLQMLMEHDKYAAEFGVEMDMLSMVFMGEIVYLVNLGESNIDIFRNGNLTSISGVLRDPTGANLVKTGSLVVKQGDVFLLTTPVAKAELSQDEYIEIAADFNESQLKRREYEDESQVAVLMVGYQVDREKMHMELAAQTQTREKTEVEVAVDMPVTVETKQQSALEQEHQAEVSVVAEEDATEEQSRGERMEESQEQPEFDSKYEAEQDDVHEPKASAQGEYKQKLLGLATGVKTKLALLGAGARDRLAEMRSKRALAQKEKAEKATALEDTKTAETSQSAESTTTSMPASSSMATEHVLRQPGLGANDHNKTTFQVISGRVTHVFAQIWEFLRKTVWGEWLGMGKDDMYLRGKRGGRNWRFIAVVALVVAGVLYFGISRAVENKRTAEAERAAETHLNAAKDMITTVESEAPSAARAVFGTRSQELLTELENAQAELDEAKKIAKYSESAKAEEERIAKLQDLINKIIPVTAPTEIVDVAGILPSANPTDIALSSGQIFISDAQYGKIYKIATGGGSLTDLAAGFTKPRSITIDKDGNIVVIDEDTDKRLSTVKASDGSVSRHAGTSENRLGNVVEIEFADIAGGRVYGIDQSISAVIFLQKNGSAYGIPEKRFDLAELAQAADLSINDLKIYALANIHSGLYRYANGQDDSPETAGLAADDNFFDSTAMFVNDLHVYIADSKNSRILVFSKGAEVNTLVATYEFRNGRGTDIRELVADRTLGKLFVLDGSKIIELSLAELNNFQ